jgi:DNA polymerase-3 subunit gamma/tau
MTSSAIGSEKPNPAQGSYQVLARKWRPKTLQDVVGQETLVQIITNAIEGRRLGHAFIFTGERGVGKTSTARILARSVNCIGTDGKGQETIAPCGVCGPCVDILAERHLDVIEMDAASHTGVEDIREIIEGARYKPSSARYKVYIIDEVHMLSKSAFNALLKTLEEPPPHVKFIFATTEIHKVPITILSRCQRFDLRRIDPVILQGYFARILDVEGAKASPEALKLIARAADGSARDGISLLDQALNIASQEKGVRNITESQVIAMLGLVDPQKMIDLMETILHGAPKEALKQLASFHAHGGDPVRLIRDLMEIVYTLTRLKAAPENTEEDRRLTGLAEKISTPILHRLWQMLSKGLAEVSLSPIPQMALEMVLLRVMYVQDLPPLKDWPFLGEKDTSPAPSQDVTHVLQDPKADEPPTIPSKFESFDALVAYLLKIKEIRFYTILVQEARLVSFNDPKMVLNTQDVKDGESFCTQLARQLTNLTDRKWTIMSDAQVGEATLSEKMSALDAARLSEARKNPLVQDILETFPSAQVKRVVDLPLPTERKA